MASHQTVEEIEASVGQQIRTLRKRSGLTQAELARDLDRTQPQVSHDVTGGLERLDTGPLGDLLETLEQALDAFGGIVSLDELEGGRDTSTIPPEHTATSFVGQPVPLVGRAKRRAGCLENAASPSELVTCGAIELLKPKLSLSQL